MEVDFKLLQALFDVEPWLGLTAAGDDDDGLASGQGLSTGVPLGGGVVGGVLGRGVRWARRKSGDCVQVLGGPMGVCVGLRWTGGRKPCSTAILIFAVILIGLSPEGFAPAWVEPTRAFAGRRRGLNGGGRCPVVVNTPAGGTINTGGIVGGRVG
jgi:hypothetical protein